MHSHEPRYLSRRVYSGARCCGTHFLNRNGLSGVNIDSDTGRPETQMFLAMIPGMPIVNGNSRTRRLP